MAIKEYSRARDGEKKLSHWWSISGDFIQNSLRCLPTSPNHLRCVRKYYRIYSREVLVQDNCTFHKEGAGMFDAVVEEIIKAKFGAENWLAATLVIIVAGTVIRFVYKKGLPRYFKGCAVTGTISIAVWVESQLFPWENSPSVQQVGKFLPPLSWAALVVAAVIFWGIYRENDQNLKYAIQNTDFDGNKIEAWKSLQEIKTTNLTPWQRKKYDKSRLYLRVFLGNMRGAEQELQNYENDKAFYHYMKAVIFNFKGKHREELEETIAAENCCNGDTKPSLQFQIIVNRGVGYVGAGAYRLADGCFQRAINFGREKNLQNSELWLNVYGNYVFNKTRLEHDISIQECLDLLEGVKDYIDVEDPKQYSGYCNIVLELLRQKNADRAQIDEVTNQNFEYLVNAKLTDTERCLLESSMAQMVCKGRLDPVPVLEKLSKDIALFQNFPMPERYQSLKQIDFMFKDLKGPIAEANKNIKETAHWYLVNQVRHDLENYRGTLPSEAVYAICDTLKEQAGLLRYKPGQYDWAEFLRLMQSAQRLYKENELFASSAFASLDIMDEALSELNVDAEGKPLHLDAIRQSRQEVEEVLPELVKHPALNEIYLRLAAYCFAMEDLEKSKHYYESFRSLGDFSIEHFAPWLRKWYSVLSLQMLVIGYIETVDKLAGTDLSGETPLVQDWFKEFHQRNGYFEAFVLGRIFGGEVMPMYLTSVSGGQMQGGTRSVGEIGAAWLVIPVMHMKIRCNGAVPGELFGPGGLFSTWDGRGLYPARVAALAPELQNAVERIAEMVKAELPAYLVSGEELNQLVEDNWFPKAEIVPGQ